MSKIRSFKEWRSQLEHGPVTEAISINWDKTGLPKDQKVEINSKEIKPYDIAFDLVEEWLEGVKTLCESNIDKPYKKVFGLAFNRVIKKIAPALARYIIPRVEADGTEILGGEQISGRQFWSLAWPQVWQELGAAERAALKKFTILDENTNYDALMNSLAATLNDPGYAPYLEIAKGEVYKLNNLFANRFSDEVGKRAQAENPFALSLLAELGGKMSDPVNRVEPTRAETSNKPETQARVQSNVPDQDLAMEEPAVVSQDAPVGGGTISTPPASDPQSVRRWFKSLNPVDQVIVRDVIKTIR